MKKILAIILALSMLMCFAACKDKDVEDTSFLGNPLVEYESLEDINSICQTNLVKPGVMGVEDVSFGVINEELAQYRFKINGVAYLFRASKDTEDISGYYNNGKTLFEDCTSEETNYYFADEVYAAQFFVGDVQYVLEASVEDTSLEEDTFKGIVEELIACVEME